MKKSPSTNLALTTLISLMVNAPNAQASEKEVNDCQFDQLCQREQERVCELIDRTRNQLSEAAEVYKSGNIDKMDTSGVNIEDGFVEPFNDHFVSIFPAGFGHGIKLQTFPKRYRDIVRRSGVRSFYEGAYIAINDFEFGHLACYSPNSPIIHSNSSMESKWQQKVKGAKATDWHCMAIPHVHNTLSNDHPHDGKKSYFAMNHAKARQILKMRKDMDAINTGVQIYRNTANKNLGIKK